MSHELLASNERPQVHLLKLCKTLLSEFETLMYLNRIGIPTPTVHEYSLISDTNDTGVNYLLMDKLDASPLMWYNLGSDQCRHVLYQLANIFVTLEHHSFRQIGFIQPLTLLQIAWSLN
ncbi:hypothetical protein K503DRAFT_822985 [Rhizopogon vinicolor AM-OR11-026]|uniref:Aminoglycoside phosphotransferase domain-containing protein n=1 Tax=Rhizopogon vinicolor AM-OR11-026 TaxID=1314800 RepID=A0A1B7MWV2_9AGAM|nr:hypothetical protein K503DRAFT_822985 [Rhizopogon vinicolor AM-OR11-026]